MYKRQLYASRFAKLGHECTGIDFSPASIAYAVAQAENEHLACTYVHQDIRTAEYGTGYGLAMLIFGEFNVFSRKDAQTILQKACNTLSDGGYLLLEPHTFEAIQEIGQASTGWYSSIGGLFSPLPHLCLTENFWDTDHHIATERYIIVDASTGDVTRYAASMQAYTEADYTDVLTECGFAEVTFYPSLTGDVDPSQHGFVAIATRKA